MSDKYELNNEDLSSVSGGTTPPEGLHIYTVAELETLCTSASECFKPQVGIYSTNYTFIGNGAFQGKNSDNYYYAIFNGITYTSQNYCFGEAVISRPAPKFARG